MKISLLSTLSILLVCGRETLGQAPGGTILARAELNHKYGCIDTTGRAVVPLQYDDLGFWGAGRISVNIGAKEVNYLLTGGKWGYCNEKGKLVIPLQFEGAGTFNEGLAGVKKGGKWGFIDTTGKIVIEPRYKEVSEFREGLCAVEVGGRWGFIDHAGKMVIQPVYPRARFFEEGSAEVYFGNIGEDERRIERTGGYGLIDKTGKRLTDTTFKFIGIWSEGLVEVRDRNNKTGFIDRRGKIVVPVIYDIVEGFSQGYAAVGMAEPSAKRYDPNRQYRYIYVNTRGEKVIGGPFSKAGRFINGFAVVSKGRQYHGYLFAYRSSDGLMEDSARYPKYALIDTAGNFVLDFKWGGLEVIDSGRLIARRAGYIGDGVIDMKGKMLIPFKYSNLNYIGSGLFAAHTEDEVQVIDSKGNTLIRTDRFAMPMPTYQYGLLGVRTGKLSRSGRVDIHGKWVIPDKYDMIWDFEPTRH